MLKKVFRITFWFALAVLFVWTIYFLYAKSQTPPEIAKTESPIITNILKKTVATGSVIPRKEVFIKPQVSGIVEKIFVEAGKMIKAGDVIARIKIIPNMVELNNAESRTNRAKINFDNSKMDYDRNADLFKSGVVAKADFQRYELAYNSAKEELQSAESNLELIRDGVAKNSGQSTNTLIRSTISGMILDVPVKEGFSVIEANTFNEGTTIASVADMGEMIFDGKVDESEVGKINQGMDLILTIGAIDNAKFAATLEYVAPKGVLENGAIQFQIKADIKIDEDHFLRAGYSANADIILSRKDSVMAIPESTLKFEKDSAYVEIESQPGKFEKRFIKTGLSDGINIEVLDGLKKTDKIKSGEAIPPPDKGNG